MKREDVRSKAKELGIELNDDLLNFIMDENGKDINKHKGANSEQMQKLQADNDALKAKNEELNANAGKYKDYDELAKYKADNEARIEATNKEAFLKSQGCKHPDLLSGKIDWSKLTYDAEKKTYTGEGLDNTIKGLKESYSDMFEEQGEPNGGNPNYVPPRSIGNTGSSLTGAEKIFYENNPDLVPPKY